MSFPLFGQKKSVTNKKSVLPILLAALEIRYWLFDQPAMDLQLSSLAHFCPQ